MRSGLSRRLGQAREFAFDRITSLLGRAGFIAGLTVFVVGWVSLNCFASRLAIARPRRFNSTNSGGRDTPKPLDTVANSAASKSSSVVTVQVFLALASASASFFQLREIF